MTWQLSTIRSKVRLLTGRPATNQIADAAIDVYINNYYQNIFPFQIDLQEVKGFDFLGNTVIGTDKYPLSSDIDSIEPPVILNGEQLQYWTDKASFFRKYREIDTFPTTGVITAFSSGTNTTVTATHSLSVGDLVQIENSTNYTGTHTVVSISTTVSFDIAATFVAETPASTTIFKEVLSERGQPLDVLFYENTLYFRPIPDAVYQFRVPSRSRPALLVVDEDVPLDDMWGPALAYGASIDLLGDSGEEDQLPVISSLLKGVLSQIERKKIMSQSGIAPVAAF